MFKERLREYLAAEKLIWKHIFPKLVECIICKDDTRNIRGISGRIQYKRNIGAISLQISSKWQSEISEEYLDRKYYTRNFGGISGRRATDVKILELIICKDERRNIRGIDGRILSKKQGEIM